MVVWCWWLVLRWWGCLPGGPLPVLPVDRLFMAGFLRVTNEPGVLSHRCTTPAFGQGSYAVFLVCLIPRPQWVGLWTVPTIVGIRPLASSLRPPHYATFLSQKIMAAFGGEGLTPKMRGSRQQNGTPRQTMTRPVDHRIRQEEEDVSGAAT